MSKLLALLGMFLFVPNVFADDNVDTRPSKEAIEQPMKLDLSVPEQDLQYQPDTSKKAYQETKEEEAKRQHCADLSRQIDALKGKFKPARRSALINQHRAECLNKGTWEQGGPN
jgi:predicted component of type VI protein secretion system